MICNLPPKLQEIAEKSSNCCIKNQEIFTRRNTTILPTNTSASKHKLYFKPIQFSANFKLQIHHHVFCSYHSGGFKIQFRNVRFGAN